MSMQIWKKLDYSITSNAAGGPGTSKAITPYVGSQYVNMSSTDFAGFAAATGLNLGSTWWVGGSQEAGGGNAYMVVKANAALSLGQCVAYDTPAASTSSGSGTATYITWAAGGLTVNAEVNNYLFVTATGASLPQLRRIKANTATVVTVALPDRLRPNSPNDADVFDTTATGGDVANIIRPFQVIVCTASLVPCGIALGTVTSGYYTIVQVAGLASVLSKGDGVALVAQAPAAPGAGGVITGFAGTATALVGTCAPKFMGAGSIIPQIASAAASLVIPCYVNLTGN